ncbi:hypothetical protein ACG0Z6_06640 [Roseateles sp. BYS180W]|uniref:Uncharacterized protein n=1 Tax=Roseateles rivi TaxID=3299028 RepID=A0ABW7FUD8_9BURK
MIKQLRLLSLLLVLLFVAVQAAWEQWRAGDWSNPQLLMVYPVAGDGAADTARYVAGLKASEFEAIEQFFAQQARAHGVLSERPIRVLLGPALSSVPPRIPERASALEAMGWALRMRWWAWRHTPPSSPVPQVRMFLIYHSEHSTLESLPHSTALQKGRIGVAHLWASTEQAEQNAVVVAHEALHTWGASDKYDRDTLMPLFPQGYAQPHQWPRHPQAQTELMAGRRALDDTHSRMPADLSEVVVGESTALEIGWRDTAR